MKLNVLSIALLAIALLMVACNAFSSAPKPVPPALPSPPTQPSLVPPSPVAAQQAATVTVTKCQSRLTGKIFNATTGQAPRNTAVQIVYGGKTLKTATDANGLYGFAGLCAGEYAMTITPPGSPSIVNPNKVKLDGSASVKVDLPYK